MKCSATPHIWMKVKEQTLASEAACVGGGACLLSELKFLFFVFQNQRKWL